MDVFDEDAKAAEGLAKARAARPDQRVARAGRKGYLAMDSDEDSEEDEDFSDDGCSHQGQGEEGCAARIKGPSLARKPAAAASSATSEVSEAVSSGPRPRAGPCERERR